MEGMPCTARVVTWNGRDVPAELRELPAGRYVVEAIDDDAPALTPDEEAGIEAALESYRQGHASMPSAPARSSTQPSVVEGHLHRRGARRHCRGDHLPQRTKSNRCRELDAEIAQCIERLAAREFDGPVSQLRSGGLVRSWGVPPFRTYYQRHPDELLIVRVLPPVAPTNYPLAIRPDRADHEGRCGDFTIEGYCREDRFHATEERGNRVSPIN